jgi:hypothetical protein
MRRLATMSDHHRLRDVRIRNFALSLAAGCLALCTLAPTALAQRSVPVTVENDETTPVPVYEAGRQPYQFVYSLYTTGSEDCDTFPVPQGKTLVLTTVGIEATIDSSDTADVYIRSTRLTGSGGSYYRFRNGLQYNGASGVYRFYKGIYDTNLFAGAANDPISYSLSICVGGPPSGFNSARGVVSGYLINGAIVDGNTLP